MWEVFQKVLNIHGNIVEVGTLDGFNILALGHFSEILEPRNYTRKVYGFDTFTHYASRRGDKDKIKSDLNLPKTYSFELLQKVRRFIQQVYTVFSVSKNRSSQRRCRRNDSKLLGRAS